MKPTRRSVVSPVSTRLKLSAIHFAIRWVIPATQTATEPTSGTSTRSVRMYDMSSTPQPPLDEGNPEHQGYDDHDPQHDDPRVVLDLPVCRCRSRTLVRTVSKLTALTAPSITRRSNASVPVAVARPPRPTAFTMRSMTFRSNQSRPRATPYTTVRPNASYASSIQYRFVSMRWRNAPPFEAVNRVAGTRSVAYMAHASARPKTATPIETPSRR